MKGRLLCCFVIIVSWVCVTSRLFAPNDGPGVVHQPGTDQSPQSLQVTLMSSKEGYKSMTVGAGMNEEASYNKEMSKIGSSPPNCERKCFGCTPCEAIQVPTTTSHVGLQYTNYEPVGWKCKCGPSFYTP